MIRFKKNYGIRQKPDNLTAPTLNGSTNASTTATSSSAYGQSFEAAMSQFMGGAAAAAGCITVGGVIVPRTDEQIAQDILQRYSGGFYPPDAFDPAQAGASYMLHEDDDDDDDDDNRHNNNHNRTAGSSTTTTTTTTNQQQQHQHHQDHNKLAHSTNFNHSTTLMGSLSGQMLSSGGMGMTGIGAVGTVGGGIAGGSGVGGVGVANNRVADFMRAHTNLPTRAELNHCLSRVRLFCLNHYAEYQNELRWINELEVKINRSLRS